VERTSQQKGKRAEFIVFGELVKKGANLYLPVIDLGIDAIIKKKDGTFSQIQVKSTEASGQAGWFNIWDLEKYEGKKLFIVCVEMSKEPPEIWVLPSEIFKKYANDSKSKEGWHKYILGIDSKDTKHENKLRRDLLEEYREAWHLLI
jgi:hypothetical protein